jgi:hypothetical protein
LQYAWSLFQRKGALTEALEFMKKYKLHTKKGGAALIAAIYAKEKNFDKAKEALSPFISNVVDAGNEESLKETIRNPFSALEKSSIKSDDKNKKIGRGIIKRTGKRFRNFKYSPEHQISDTDRWLPKSVKKQRKAEESQGGDAKGLTSKKVLTVKPTTASNKKKNTGKKRRSK